MATAAMVVASLPLLNDISAANDTSDLRVDRYTVRSATATDTQLMPLNQVVSIRFSTGTVREAIKKVLEATGYQVYSLPAPVLAATMKKPLAVTQRRFRNIRIIEILHALAGPAFTVLVDPANRLVSFELEPAYRSVPQRRRRKEFSLD